MIDNSESGEFASCTTTKCIAYMYSDSFIRTCDKGLRVPLRASVTHTLIEAYGLLNKMDIIAPTVATKGQLTEFHSEDYIEYLYAINDDDDLEKRENQALEFGIGYDCPLMTNQFDFVATIAGGSLTAVQCLNDGSHNIAINWCGGWHHGKKDEAAGFCYINDIVLAILRLRQKYDRILYVDMDLHHGDGVEDAFCYSTKVMTVSFHKYEEGFYPGSGALTDVGHGKGQYYSVNIPLKDGIRDDQYVEVFKSVTSSVKEHFHPDVVVCQCGADGIFGDPMSSFNLTPHGLGQCVTELLLWKLPVLFLGGGGYHIYNTARCWTYLTSVITGCLISSDIPDNPFFIHYGPGYELDVLAGNRPNCNTVPYIKSIINVTKENLKTLNIKTSY